MSFYAISVTTLHHFCCYGNERTGLDEITCIICEMIDIKAVREMQISNKKRGNSLQGELTHLLNLEMEALIQQRSQSAVIAAGDVEKALRRS